MNGSDKQYMGRKFANIDYKLQALHDDVLVIKTERRTEKKFLAVIAGAVALAVSTITGLIWR